MPIVTSFQLPAVNTHHYEICRVSLQDNDMIQLHKLKINLGKIADKHPVMKRLQNQYTAL